MSIASMNWALSQWLDPGMKMVLIAIADCINHKGGSSVFPSLTYIAETSCQHRRTVQRHIMALEQLGLLVKVHRRADDGRQTSNLYQINMDVVVRRDGAETCDEDALPVDNLPPSSGGQNDTLGGGAGATLGGGAGATPTINRKNEPEKEPIPPKAPQGAKEKRGNDDDEEGFARFFETWTSADPGVRFDKRGPAFGAWKRLTPAERQAAALTSNITAVIIGQRRAKRTTLMNAATYLRDRTFQRVDAVTAASSGPAGLVRLALFGRPWWCRFYEHAKGGSRSLAASKAKFMIQQAEHGQGMAVPLSEAQALETASESYVYVLTASPDFAAWAEWFADRGIRLPRPSRVDRIWMPSARPDDLAEAAQ